jgi:hypothetical protein
MYIGRQPARIVERPDSNEPNFLMKDQVVAPHSYLAFRATKNLLVLPAGRGDHHANDVAFENLYPIFLDEGVHGECGAILALAEAAMAAVHDQRLGCQPVANMLACAGTRVWLETVRHYFLPGVSSW